MLGSVANPQRLHDVFGRYRPNWVYHAAAYKHVPLVESNPAEGIMNNVFGTLNVARAAVESHVANMVLVSTDKAVRPTNVMGASKRMAELVLQAMAAANGKTRFCMVRFGNVLGSSGSVVPLFRSQLASGGPLTVTHPEVTRYFMTIPEAAQLVLYAGAMAKGGEVFVLDMGEPVKIMDLARRMIDLGFWLGIGGVLTYPKSDLGTVLRDIPLEHLVLETDAPYLPPVPYRGKRNESAYVPLVAEKLAEVKNLPVEEIARVTTANARRVFNDE